MAEFEQIQLNRIRLDACPRHCFEAEGLIAAPGVKATCKVCGGSMGLIEVNQYVRGYEAAGGDPLEVWAGWKEPGEETKCRCPQCLGRKYIEPRPNDFFDCDLCYGEEYVNVSIARQYFEDKERGQC